MIRSESCFVAYLFPLFLIYWIGCIRESDLQIELIVDIPTLSSGSIVTISYSNLYGPLYYVVELNATSMLLLDSQMKMLVLLNPLFEARVLMSSQFR